MSGDRAFDDWFAKLDRIVTGQIGFSVLDLPDMSFRDWFDDGITAEQAVELVLAESFA